MPTTVSRSTDGFLRPWAPHTPPEAHVLALAYQLRRGKSFERALTKRERLLIALTTAPPTAFVTLDSPALSRSQLSRAWDLLIKRLKRNLHASRPPIYLAAPALNRQETAGYHIHALFWHYVHRPVLAKHAHAVGFGAQPYELRDNRRGSATQRMLPEPATPSDDPRVGLAVIREAGIAKHVQRVAVARMLLQRSPTKPSREDSTCCPQHG